MYDTETDEPPRWKESVGQEAEGGAAESPHGSEGAGAEKEGLNITKEEEHYFLAEGHGWDVFAKWDGCVNFTRQGENDYVHICELREFAKCVNLVLAEMEKRQYEL